MTASTPSYGGESGRRGRVVSGILAQVFEDVVDDALGVPTIPSRMCQTFVFSSGYLSFITLGRATRIDRPWERPNLRVSPGKAGGLLIKVTEGSINANLHQTVD